MLGAEALDPAQHGRMKGADTKCAAQPRQHAVEGGVGIERQRDWNRWRAVIVGQGDHRHHRAGRGGDLQAEHPRAGVARRLAQLRDQHGGRLDRHEGRRRIGPGGIDDREGAGGAQYPGELAGRSVGDNDNRALQGHGARTRVTKRRAA